MHPLVRDLYKRFIWLSKDYPTGREDVRNKVKSAFFSDYNTNLKPYSKDPIEEEKFKRAIHYGRYIVKECIALIQLKKYRQMNKTYGRFAPDYNNITNNIQKAQNNAYNGNHNINNQINNQQ